MAFSGCNGKQKKQERKRENRQESQQEKKETVKADNKDLSKSEQSLQNLQKNLRRSRMPMAAAYLGYADDNSPFRDQVRTLLKNGKYEEQYSFLADVPKENYISYNGEEVYAIVPQSTQYAMKVESFDWDENVKYTIEEIEKKYMPVDKDNYTYFANRFDVNKVIYENKITWLVNSGNQEILINTENGNVISRKILTYKE